MAMAAPCRRGLTPAPRRALLVELWAFWVLLSLAHGGQAAPARLKAEASAVTEGTEGRGGEGGNDFGGDGNNETLSSVVLQGCATTMAASAGAETAMCN